MKAFIQHGCLEGDKGVLQALVPFMELKDSVLFTSKANPGDEDKKVNTESNYKYYQRRIDLSRIKKIEDFIIDSILDERDGIILATLFPSSMILAINDDENEVKTDADNPEACDITLKSNVFIVDGQHRMLALKRVYQKLLDRQVDLTDDERQYVINYIEHYKFNCTILVNYDLWEQGQVFINVNFKQKPVNKSLYYEIFGSEYRESRSDWKRNQTYLAHCLARSLNENPESPYCGKVKMLGTGKGYISQAFVVESLLQHFRKDGIWEYNTLGSIEDVDIAYYSTELVSYFHTIHKLFIDYWPKGEGSEATRICKSTAFGAFGRLMKDVRTYAAPSLVRALKESSLQDNLCEYYIRQVETLFQPLVIHAEKLFGVSSEFANGSGKGTESKLYKVMLHFINQSSHAHDSLPENIDVDELSLQIQQHLWAHPVDDLDPLAHSYEVEEISDFEIKKIKQEGTAITIESSFNLSVTLYIDNEDVQGFVMEFPASCKAQFYDKSDTLQLDEDSVFVNVNTDKFYD